MSSVSSEPSGREPPPSVDEPTDGIANRPQSFESARFHHTVGTRHRRTGKRVWTGVPWSGILQHRVTSNKSASGEPPPPAVDSHFPHIGIPGTETTRFSFTQFRFFGHHATTECRRQPRRARTDVPRKRQSSQPHGCDLIARSVDRFKSSTSTTAIPALRISAHGDASRTERVS